MATATKKAQDTSTASAGGVGRIARVTGPVVQFPRWFMVAKAPLAFSLAASTHMDIFWRIGTGADIAMVISHQPALRVAVRPAGR